MAAPIATSEPKGSSLARFRAFLKDVEIEAKKVNWPSKQELRESTLVVIATVAIVSAFIFVIDRIWDFVIRGLLSVGR